MLTGFIINTPGLYAYSFKDYCQRLGVEHTIEYGNSLNATDKGIFGYPGSGLVGYSTALLASVSSLTKYGPKLDKSTRIFLYENPAVAALHGIPSVGAELIGENYYDETSYISVEEISFEQFSKLIREPEAVTVNRVKDPSMVLAGRFLANNIKAAALAPIITFMYRIDKNAGRTEAQNVTFAYLWGVYQKIPSLLLTYPSLVALLQNTKSQALRNACLAVKAGIMSVEEASVKFDIDKFEISYLRSRLTGE